MSQKDEGSRPEDLAAKLITVTEASKLAGMTPAWIRRLVKRGDIAGIRVGRDWLTTEESVRDYLSQDRRPGPKTK